ncbi:hypothetical protein [Streptomyces sp. MP131-18]|uniref:hypothetical protein n=1 Tax=Streptomyces sp. MP131-18 TaxID=1857892 RepID=UPI00097BE0FF|nr:hypothetical protein [Streptomyces sp. MP131-18]ONK09454.1 hypothetical protein STBA_01540 [Streptomyces sp. MP131-18]
MIRDLVHRLSGKTTAHTSQRALREALTAQARRVRNEGQDLHELGARRIDGGTLGFQPGLVELHGDLVDIEIYLAALGSEGRRRGHRDLARHIDAAGKTAQTLRGAVAAAAEATT